MIDIMSIFLLLLYRNSSNIYGSRFMGHLYFTASDRVRHRHSYRPPTEREVSTKLHTFELIFSAALHSVQRRDADVIHYDSGRMTREISY
jgi:hypothetical protein